MSRLSAFTLTAPALPGALARGRRRAARMTALKRRSPWHS